LAAVSPIILGHGWDPSLTAGSPTVLYQKSPQMFSPKTMWELIFSRVLSIVDSIRQPAA
jgi:hypothetical protein